MKRSQKYTLREQRHREALKLLIDTLDPSKLWDVEIKPHVKKRSLDQNSRVHKIIGLIAKETGNTHDAIWEIAKQEFVVPEVVEINGRVYNIRTTKNKDTIDFSEFMEAVEAWAATEFGITLAFDDVPYQRSAA